MIRLGTDRAPTLALPLRQGEGSYIETLPLDLGERMKHWESQFSLARRY